MEQDLSLALANSEKDMNTVNHVPIVSSYNDQIRPLLDAVDKLRHMMIMKEGIQLPTIVVVGDQSSGKSSVLESLSGINLPRGQGICTRVPLVMRLQNQLTKKPELFLEFNGRTVRTDEAHVTDAIDLATNEIAGNGKGISNAPLTLVVKKYGVPDLTMVDLPGITRVPVHGQPENIYEQISEIIMEYIKPEESIILNVLSASVDFTTCESIRMSQKVDKTGERTLAVVTKSDKSPEGLFAKVTADDVKIGLGYVCVRNRIGDESYEEARKEEAELFDTHPLLSKIDESMVGIPVLAQKLMKIQGTILIRRLPEIFRKINEKLNASVLEMNKMPKILSSFSEVMTALMGIIGSAKESLRKILLRGEYDEYPDDHNMHCTARLVEVLNQYSFELHNCSETNPDSKFLEEEIQILEEAKGFHLPNFIEKNVFQSMLCRKVEAISIMPVPFLDKVWNYIEKVVLYVLISHSNNYPQLHCSTRRSGQRIISKLKEQSINWVMEIIQMEKLTGYTCNPEYSNEYNKLMSQQQEFIDETLAGSSKINIEGFGVVEVSELKKDEQILSQAFDLKMRMIAYWKIVLWRHVDCMALHLQNCVKNLVDKDWRKKLLKS